MRNLYWIFLFCGVAISGFSQSGSINQDLKVGLVLSGGGAKGLAHVGALKVIEESGIRLDYIGGTSMGAIVGALYASGYSATQLDSLFTETDLENLIQDNIPRGAKTFYEKEDSERYALTLPVNDFKVTFPQAISGGQNIYNLLVQLLFHVRDVNDFNRLPIPFFCIATDVETGEEVLLNSGYLPEAIMASGTFPSLFEPAEIEGRLLIDGGVLNNYPVEELRDLGAELVIGVDVQHGLRSREELFSAAEVLLQISNYRTIGEMEEKSKLTDIYIKPEIDDYSVFDFNLRDTILALGEISAKNLTGEMRKAAALQVRSTPTIRRVKIPDSLSIDRLIIEGNNNYTRAYVLGKLRLDIGKRVSFERLHQGISNLAATDNFKTIRYKIISEDSVTRFVLKLEEDPTRSFLRIGAHYNDLYQSAALINLTRKHFFFDDDVATLDLILGDNLRYNAEYYLDKGFNWSFGVNSRYNQFNKSVGYQVLQSNFDLPQDDNINSVNLDISDLSNQVYLQTVFREEFALSIGIEHKYLEYSTKTLAANSPQNNSIASIPNSGRYFFEKSHFASVFGNLTLDSYDDKYFPTQGIFAEGRFNLYLLSTDYNLNFKEFSVARGSIGGAFSIAPNLSLNLKTGGGFKLGKSPVTSMDFVLGGTGSGMINNFIPFVGYDFLSLPGNSYIKAYGRMDWEFSPENHLLFSANFANVADDLFRTGDWFEWPTYSGYGFGYGWESFFGPLQVIYAWSPEGNSKGLFFSLGYWF
jgi:NTE family protein